MEQPLSRGCFITFEGLDGSGKTTQLRRLAGSLRKAGRDVVTTRQPGDTALGERIRGLLLDSRSEAAVGAITPLAELALMFADRAQAIGELIVPSVAAGKIVLCDRYTDSSEAYQGAGRELGSERVLAVHRAVCDDLQPDLTLLLLPDLATSLFRARRRNTRHAQQHGTDENRFEREGDAFYTRVPRRLRSHRAARARTCRRHPRRCPHRSCRKPDLEAGHRKVRPRSMSNATDTTGTTASAKKWVLSARAQARPALVRPQALGEARRANPPV